MKGTALGAGAVRDGRRGGGGARGVGRRWPGGWVRGGWGGQSPGGLRRSGNTTVAYRDKNATG